MSFPKNLKKLRKKIDLSQGKLALKAKISRPYMTQLENGTRGPSVPVIEKLAKALGCTPSDLMK